jgi:hypothetical protein
MKKVENWREAVEGGSPVCELGVEFEYDVENPGPNIDLGNSWTVFE